MTRNRKVHPGLYVHIPFCRSRCGYCSFTSGEYSEGVADAYIAAVHDELKVRNIFSPKFLPSTVFLGGGTPSMLTPSQLDALLSGLPHAIEEATCEVNPDSITKDKIQILLDHGFNRISIGVQTFSPEGLHVLDRPHDADLARHAVELVAGMGCKNISVDLISCWPGQTLECLKNDIIISLSLDIQHISCYTMILEPSCRKYSSLFDLMSQYVDPDEREKRYWDFIEEYLENKKFIHYETSNYALSDYQCRHNTYIWRGGEYLGLGIAAHSHIDGRRFSNTSNLYLYLKNSQYPLCIEDMSEELVGEEKAKECAVFWLRLFEGIEAKEFFERTGITIQGLYGERLEQLCDGGFLEWSEDSRFLRVPKEKQAVLDSILVELL